RTGNHLRSINLQPQHSVEVLGLTLPLLYVTFVWWKASLNIYDAIVLVLLYAAYLALLTKLPPEKDEGIEDLEAIPRAIALAQPVKRNIAILACFMGGGVIIYFSAEPFLGSLVSLATAMGIP